MRGKFNKEQGAGLVQISIGRRMGIMPGVLHGCVHGLLLECMEITPD